jgi:hypothetical protein
MMLIYTVSYCEVILGWSVFIVFLLCSKNLLNTHFWANYSWKKTFSLWVCICTKICVRVRKPINISAYSTYTFCIVFVWFTLKFISVLMRRLVEFLDGPRINIWKKMNYCKIYDKNSVAQICCCKYKLWLDEYKKLWALSVYLELTRFNPG